MILFTFIGIVEILFIGVNIESSEGYCGNRIHVRYAREREFPHQAQLGYRARTTVYCGATILNDRHVLTSIQCIQKDIFDSAVVAVGTIYFSNLTTLADQIIPAVKYFISQYHTNDVRNGYDLAIVKVKRPFAFGDAVQAVALVTDEMVGRNCVGIGWGITAPSYGGCTECFSYVLKVIDLPFIDHEKCERIFSTLGTTLVPGMVCAGYTKTGSDACKGDPGGPLICDGKLRGVISFGDGCGRMDAPGIFTDIIAMSQWMTATLTISEAEDVRTE